MYWDFGNLEKMIFEKLRKEYHKNLLKHVLSIDKSGIPNNADRHSKISVALALGIIEAIRLSDPTSFSEFTENYLACQHFVQMDHPQ
jgi:hypothetical protein